MRNITTKFVTNNIRHQHGFTLIELMISLVLGLLISAAVMQVFLTSQRVDRIQTAASEIQDKAVFGLQAIESQVRIANLGNDGVPTNDTTVLGGIVLTAGNSEDNGGDATDKEEEVDKDKEDDKDEDQCDINKALDSEKRAERKIALNASKKCLDGMKNTIDNVSKKGFDNLKKELKNGLDDSQKDLLDHEIEKIKDELEGLKDELEGLKKKLDNLKGDIQDGSKDKLNEINRKVKDIAQREIEINKRQESIRENYGNNSSILEASYLEKGDYRNSQPAVFFQRTDFKRAGFQKVLYSKPSLFNVVVKEGLASGYLTRSGSMSSSGGDNIWEGLSNTNQSSDQLTIQYTNTTGHLLYDCEGAEIALNDRVITRYFVEKSSTGTGKTRENLNLRCDAGRITTDGTLKDFMDSGETIIENIDQFNIRLGVQRSSVDDDPLNYQYADMTVADYMALSGEKPAIINIRIAILARSTANSPEASADKFLIFGKEQSLKEQEDAPKYLRRVYESNILLRNARIMRVINTTVV
ncbi:PilW family protein [Psychrobacter sp. GP33]|uniref:PilW family protein n=1 Tax=Psychrobacter sp. GP33 TaxID=2758709 RepID=UPI0015FCCA3E|nr:PilW family protein [Psychrobacter sp. GP33]